jgi:hypothetical protein
MTSIATLGGPQYPDGSSGHHIPRRVLQTLPGVSSEYVSKSESEPHIKLRVGTSGVQLFVASGPPLDAVASRKATSGGGYVVFFARPGVRMLARIEGLDDKLAEIESPVMSGPYALFPHQARAALAECGDDFSRLIPHKQGTVIERHCAYDARNIETLTPSSSGHLGDATQLYGTLDLGDSDCDCDTRLTNYDDSLSYCEPHRIVNYRRNDDHELINSDKNAAAYVRLCIYKHKGRCAVAVQCRPLFDYYVSETRVTCTLVVWRCTPTIGRIQHKSIIPIPAEITLVWEYWQPVLNITLSARPKEGEEWRVNHLRSEMPAEDAFPRSHVPFPPFLYAFRDAPSSYAPSRIPSKLIPATNVEELTDEFDTYRLISQAMDAVAYVVKQDEMLVLDQSRSDVYAERSGNVVLRFYDSSSERSLHLPIAHVQLEDAPRAKFVAVSSVLFNSTSSRFTLVSTLPGSKAVTCTLKVSPLSKLWPLLHTLCSAAQIVRLDASTLTAIGFSESDTWIPRVSPITATNPITTMRTTAAPLNFSLPGAVADTPAPSGLTSAPVPGVVAATPAPSGLTSAPVPGAVRTTQQGRVPLTETGTVAVLNQTTGSPERQAGYSVLIGVAVLAVVAILLMRARKRRRR